MLTYRLVNARGCLESASATVLPDSTSNTTFLVTSARALLSRLLGENREGLHQRQTRVDHRRELTGEDDDVARLDRAAADFLGGVLIDLDDTEPLLSELGNDVIARRRIDRRGAKIAVECSRRVGKSCHLLILFNVLPGSPTRAHAYLPAWRRRLGPFCLHPPDPAGQSCAGTRPGRR